jgi:DNA-binding MarR family transcriptional regulator
MAEHEWTGQVPGLKHHGNESHLIFEIMRTQRALMNIFSRKMGMPFSRLTLLRILAQDASKGIGILEIARRLNINGAAVTHRIKEMEELGLVARISDKRDSRRSPIRLTSKGRRLFNQIHETQHHFEECFASSELSQEEVQIAVNVLSRLRVVLEKSS